MLYMAPILYASRSAYSKMRAHDRAVQPPAQPRLVACLGLIARLQLLLQLPHQHVHQVFLDSLHRARLEEVGAEARLAQVSRSCGPPAATAGALSAKVPASAPLPSLSGMRRPRLSTGTSIGQARATSQCPSARSTSICTTAMQRDEVQMLGEQTWQERDAAAREAAVEIDD